MHRERGTPSRPGASRRGVVGTASLTETVLLVLAHTNHEAVCMQRALSLEVASLETYRLFALQKAGGCGLSRVAYLHM